MKMLSRNRVADFATWWSVFESHAEAHRTAGLHLEGLWQAADDPNEVFFLFGVEDRARADEFLHAPESAEAGTAAGVLEGAYWYVEETRGY